MDTWLAVLVGLALASGAFAQSAPAATPTTDAGSIVDLHGPDGLGFTGDDPLRVNVAAHRGVFFLSYNSVGPFKVHANIPPVNPLPPAAPEKTELGFIDLSNQRVSRIALQPFGKQWGPPLEIGRSDPPPGWGDNADFIVAGAGLRHEIFGNNMLQSRTKDQDAAVHLDPDWIRTDPGETAGCPGAALAGLMEKITALGIDYISLERFQMDKGQVISATRMPALFDDANDADFSNALAASFRVRIGEVWSKLKGGIGGFIVGTLAALVGPLFNLQVTDGYIRMPTQEIRQLSDVPPGMAEGITGQISDNPALNGKVTATQVLTAAMADGDPDCAALGITDPSVCETALKPLVMNARSSLHALVQGPKMIQGMLDCVSKYQPPLAPGQEPTYGWREWKDLTKSKLSGVIDRVVKIPLKDELKKLMVGDPASAEDRGRPNQSGGFIFNSAYFYGPKGLWLIQRRRGDPPGLVEQYVYARLNSINPYDSEGADGEQTIRWRQLDLITQKPRVPEPPRLPWPPATTRPGGADRDLAAYGNGTGQLVGDEGANGTAPGDPEQASTMAMAVNPDEKTGRLNVAFTVRSSMLVGQQRGDLIPWARIPANPAETIPLPPTYKEAGVGARNFRVGITNRKLGRVPQGFRYNWDFDCDGKIDSFYGNVTRRIKSTGQVAACYVVDPVTQRTGVGQERVNP